MFFYNDIREMIGKTPMLKLNNVGIKSSVGLYAKLELFNPGGSVKDRIGIYMLNKAEEEGKLNKGYTIIEATAGNTGLGVALAAINRGYNIIFVVPEKFSIEKQALMMAFGAKIINTPREKGMLGAIDKATELLKSIKNSLSLQQFENPANPLAHYETTGPEIYEAMEGNIDYIVAGAGTGGTFTGVVRYLKEIKPSIKGVLADPVGSTIGGGIEGCYNIEGIGNNFIPATMDMSIVDQVYKVEDDEALYYVRELARKEGLIVGSSSGAAVAASIRLAQTIDKGNIVVILPDRGDRYFSKNLY